MKRLLSLAAALCLISALAVPAAAANTADTRLTAVTQTVKNTLGLDTTAYNDFSGELSENQLAPMWHLTWKGDVGVLNVTATEAGKVLSLYRYDAAENSGGDTGPAFPAHNSDQAKAAALAFLGRVLDSSLETVQLNHDTWKTDVDIGTSEYYFSGNILLHGLPAPLTCSIAVRASDLAIINFNREDISSSYLGGVPSSTPSGAGDEGTALLSLPSLRLEYVRGDQENSAVLRYLPNAMDDYYVDAQTGEMVNLSELRSKFDDGDRLAGGSGNAEMAKSEADGGFTDAEQTGISKLKGVLASDALSKKVTALNELGLSKYTLVHTSYFVGEADDTGVVPVTAQLTYARQSGDDVWRRFVTVDARTGQLQSVHTWTPELDDKDIRLDADDCQSKAEAFLNKYYGDQAKTCALYEKPTGSVLNSDHPEEWEFQYARQENGYFFEEDGFNVSVDATDGSISAYHQSWDDQITFDSPDGIVSADAALDTYVSGFSIILSYQAVPQALDLAPINVRPMLKEMGASYFYALKLGYVLSSDTQIEGIDAKSGKPVVNTVEPGASITYDDLDGSWVKAPAEALASYGVGWTGGSLQPDKVLNQRDLVALLVSTQGVQYDPEDDKNADQLYSRAYRMGILTPDQRSDNSTVIRGALVKYLLDWAGYGEVAGLDGIFRCDYQDQASIPSEYYGYAALAQGLGLVKGDGAGNFSADHTATRAEAAAILYNFLVR